MTSNEENEAHTDRVSPPDPSMTARSSASASFLVISDMHLGSDIAEGASFRPPARSESVDDDLRALLDHYRDARADGEPWHMIINGDFIDFIGISIDATGA